MGIPNVYLYISLISVARRIAKSIPYKQHPNAPNCITILTTNKTLKYSPQREKTIGLISIWENNVLSTSWYFVRKKQNYSWQLIWTLNSRGINDIDRLDSLISRKWRVFNWCFLNFSKAFNTVNHDVILQKLQHYNIRGPALEWFQSYLSDRCQYVMYKWARIFPESYWLWCSSGFYS